MSDEPKPCDKCHKMECERTIYNDEPCEYMPKCEFCKERDATCWVQGDDASHVCKDCKKEWDNQPSGWWA